MPRWIDVIINKIMHVKHLAHIGAPSPKSERIYLRAGLRTYKSL